MRQRCRVPGRRRHGRGCRPVAASRPRRRRPKNEGRHREGRRGDGPGRRRRGATAARSCRRRRRARAWTTSPRRCRAWPRRWLATAGGKPAEPVSFRDLQTAFPPVNGWTMDKPKGERMTTPVAFSQTETRYRRATPEIEVKIVDSAFSRCWWRHGRCSWPPATRRRPTTATRSRRWWPAIPASRSGTSAARSGELNLVVAKRFLVSVEGDSLADMKQLHEFAVGWTSASWPRSARVLEVARATARLDVAAARSDTLHRRC